jgi:hypothetical protein
MIPSLAGGRHRWIRPNAGSCPPTPRPARAAAAAHAIGQPELRLGEISASARSVSAMPPRKA